MLLLGLRELCSKSSSLFYSEFLKNCIIILIIMLKIYWLFSLFSTLQEIFYNFFSLLQSKYSKIFYSLSVLLSETVTAYRVAVIVVKCSVTSVWGYKLLRADRSIRVSDCSIRVSWSVNWIIFMPIMPWNYIKILE